MYLYTRRLPFRPCTCLLPRSIHSRGTHPRAEKRRETESETHGSGAAGAALSHLSSLFQSVNDPSVPATRAGSGEPVFCRKAGAKVRQKTLPANFSANFFTRRNKNLTPSAGRERNRQRTVYLERLRLRKSPRPEPRRREPEEIPRKAQSAGTESAIRGARLRFP